MTVEFHLPIVIGISSRALFRAEDEDTFLQALADGGFQVGELSDAEVKNQ